MESQLELRLVAVGEQDVSVHHCPSQEVQSEQSHGSGNRGQHADHDQERARSTYIPDHDRLCSPSDARLDICADGNVVIQELEQVVALFLFQADNAACDCFKNQYHDLNTTYEWTHIVDSQTVPFRQ